MKLRTWKTSEARGAAIWCGPCGCAHSVTIEGPNAWEWNGSRVAPTLTPSLLLTSPGDDGYRCHSVVTSGMIFYCPDSKHALAGKTVPLEDFPSNYGGSWDDTTTEEQPTMRFEIKGDLVLHHDERPGEHATLFHNGRKLSFRDDHSHFHDGNRRYSWAFDKPADLKAGDVLIFAAGDREVEAVVGEDGHASVRLTPQYRVVRLGAINKPLAVEAIK